MKKLLLPAIVFAALALFGYGQRHSVATDANAPVAAAGDSLLASAIDSHASGIQIEGRGTVAKILPDDNQGSRHQRFLVRVSSGQTILIAHNIDVAERVAPLTEGDAVSFSGEYEWNPKGGVIHWTHRDPHGRHSAGWIKRGSQTFQ